MGLAWKLLEMYHHDEHDICAIGIATYMFNSIFTGAGFWTILFATLDRYLALILHLRYRSLVTVKRVIISCAFIWITASLQIFLLLRGPQELYNISTGIAMVLWLSIIAFCYYQIFTIIRRHHIQIASQAANTTAIFPNLSRYQKSVFSLVYVMCCQLIFVIPYTICLSFLAALGVSVEVVRFWSVSIALLFLSPLVNPLLIYMRYGELRVAVKETASCLWNKVKQTA